MDEEFLDLGAVRLIRGRGEIELHGAYDVCRQPRHDNAARSGLDGGQNLGAPEIRGVAAREREDEADACSGVDAGLQNSAEHVEIGIDGIGAGLPSLDLNGLGLSHRFHLAGWTMESRYRAGRVQEKRDGPIRT